jgi:hypothetical protein
MAKWSNSTVLDGGLSYIKANCNAVHLIATYAPNDSRATVVANSLANIAMVNSDFTIAGAAGAARVCSAASNKTSGGATAGGGGSTSHFAFISATEVLIVTPETSGQTIVLLNPVNFPALSYTSSQPTP